MGLALLASSALVSSAVLAAEYVVDTPTTETNGDLLGHVLVGGGNLTISDTGSITTTGQFATGILAVTNNPNITNTGIIFTTGIGAIGIQVQNDNVVNNSGCAVSAQRESFWFTGAGSTLNLMAPSFIGWEIDLGTDTTLTITTGRSQSVLWTF
ncbi:MAG: hypothetical protein L3J21_07670 [Devosiaceae bacterium]|nr:hypothetical protein [Devosiaceae bacterium]